jgi:hypothetical protein
MPFLYFEAVSRLKINLFKSEIVPVGDVGNVEGFVVFPSRAWGGGGVFTGDESKFHLVKSSKICTEKFDSI